MTAADLLAGPAGPITEAGLRPNLTSASSTSGLGWWLGCVPIFNLMEDAATCEISPQPSLAVDPAARGACSMTGAPVDLALCQRDHR